jgi:hypothetical protein
MSAVIVTLVVNPGNSLDLELPSDIPIELLLPRLQKTLGHAGAGGRMTFEGRRLRAGESLDEAGVLTGSVLCWHDDDEICPPRGALRLPSGRPVELSSLGKHQVVLGRPWGDRIQAPDVDLSRETDGDTVSRTHAVLIWSGDSWLIKALTTTNKTLVNGSALEPGDSRSLRANDRIRLGGLEVSYVE